MKQPKVDLYKTLGLTKTASESEIKKAYRLLARMYHPDMHTNKPEGEKQKMQEMFKDVSNAYEILSDPKKKDFYDKTGTTAPPGVDPSSFGFSDMFSGDETFQDFGKAFGGGGGHRFFDQGEPLFEGLFGGSNFGARSKHSRAPAGPNPIQEYHLGITLEEICNGADKTLKLSKRLRTGEMVKKTLVVNIQRGYKKGTKITFPNAGDELADGRSTDFVVVLDEKPHPLFKRSGCDLIYEFDLGLKDALRETVKTIGGVLGNKISIAPKHLGANLKGGLIEGEGLPDRSRGYKRGNLILSPRVFLDLTEGERSAVKRALL
ncbi:hypothetical protein NEDG_01071 [Nematocida displodere]|uniref:J domain-containing protein n=1 Tax=Nematocida displodere TaxID=1805483 RepID=A0A177ECP4_9MICR|nr:hypothetical protein NEDG_01071 [Nematocida displodere]